MAEAYKNIINNLRKGLIDQCELNSLENGFEQLFKRIEVLEIESYKNDEQKAEMQSHIDCLKAELAEIQMKKQELPINPIEVATMLIKAKMIQGFPLPYEKNRYSDEELKQIAEHLLVYCNHAEVE